MDQIRKNKIKEVMIKTLTDNVGYPNCEPNQILMQLKPMWLKLEEAGLTEGLSFQAFQEHAQSQCMMSQFKGFFF